MVDTKDSNSEPKIKALKILKEGLDSADPSNFIRKFVIKNQIKLGNKIIQLSKYNDVYLISFGKAADSMAQSIDKIIKIKNGIIVIPNSTKSVVTSKRYKILKASHPIPNSKSVVAAKSILKFLKKVGKNDFIIFCVSGGGSALLSHPYGITLKEKQILTKVLLNSGATIQEINCIRKHLSLIKGGRLVENLPCYGIALVVSDVENDDLSSISSGCTYYDSTTFGDALKIIKKYKIEKKIPKNVLKHLRKGLEGKIPETPKKQTIINKIIANNKICIKSMQHKATQFGISFKTIQLFGNIENCVDDLILKLPTKQNSCLIFGGEPTVKITGYGKGGRNQELVLRVLERINQKDYIVCSIGTDGIDGNTKKAGAIFDTSKIVQTKIKSFLKNNDSNSFFKKYGGLIATGPTHTNLLDIGLIFHY